MQEYLPQELQNLVSEAVSLLGKSVKSDYGHKIYQEVEKIRLQMKRLRGEKADVVLKKLNTQSKKLDQLSAHDLHKLAHTYSLMMELINRAESAYRSFRLGKRTENKITFIPHAMIFVLTAHPTEARSLPMLKIFDDIQFYLEQILLGKKQYWKYVEFSLKLSLKLPLSPQEKPEVSDEAEQIYNYAVKDEILDLMADYKSQGIVVSFRTWVGGDKDGHPGVDEKTMVMSLTTSRNMLIDYILRKMSTLSDQLNLIQEKVLYQRLNSLAEKLISLREIKEGDGKKITSFENKFKNFYKLVSKKLDEIPELEKINNLLWLFPALVVPLELREDSEDVKMALSDETKSISRMLKTLGLITLGHDPKWYARGFIISMVMNSDDLNNGYKLVKKHLKKRLIPVVPLLENAHALTHGAEIISQFISANKEIIKLHKIKWGSRFEIMVGYSDSAKENGVLPSRLMIYQAIHALDHSLKEFGLKPVFFHGSGGSIERGGGSIEEQTSWWPMSALSIYKVTIQGEMVSRQLGSPKIFSSQIDQITSKLKSKVSPQIKNSKALNLFLELIKNHYQNFLNSALFKELLLKATPYQYLSELKIGSRPTKRQTGTQEIKLRAIPWVLCWTQMRILFPTWWGVGSSWKTLNESQRYEVLKDFKNHPVLQTYIKQLGFTLEKIELGVFQYYIQNSKLDKKSKNEIIKLFNKELEATIDFFYEIQGKDFLWFRPWLKESIYLRSAMIHPLNLIQIQALKRKNSKLLRETVTGVACGMLTTG
jgi:phosphoenolpyruvate carboxylase